MRIADFELERFFAKYEFAVQHLLCASDVQGWPMGELLELADDETAALWRDLGLGYTESLGHPLLRREIAALYEGIDPDEVVVFSGAEEAIFAVGNTALGPGDHAIVVWPAYQSLHEVARAAGADVILHELHASDGWAIDVDLLRRQVTPRTRLIVVNAPHNPTGYLPTWRRTAPSRTSRPRPVPRSCPTRCTGSSSSTRPAACPRAPTLAGTASPSA